MRSIRLNICMGQIKVSNSEKVVAPNSTTV